MFLRSVVWLGFLLLTSANVLATETDRIVIHQEWAEVFKNAGIKGTVVLKNDGDGPVHIFNVQRANEPRVPASTFKIINSMIAYELGIVTDENKIFKWDGKPQWLKSWEQDMNIRTAMALSAVPVYQRIATEIGPARMSAFVKRLDYGNGSIEGGITNFWLSGGLRITPVQQVHMVEKLFYEQFPVSREAQKFVKSILPVVDNSCFMTRGKTGLAFVDNKPQHGWWVGWANRVGVSKPIFFALNVDISDMKFAKLRQSIVFEILSLYHKLSPKDCNSQ